MDNRQLYCGACDREVRVLITEAPSADGQATVQDAELVCLEIGKYCTGTMCPLGAAEPSAMVGRIIRNGIPLDTLETVHATCPTCEAETEIILYGNGKASCSVCGIGARWVVDHIEAE
jgi:hypothetical protein